MQRAIEYLCVCVLYVDDIYEQIFFLYYPPIQWDANFSDVISFIIAATQYFFQ